MKNYHFCHTLIHTLTSNEKLFIKRDYFGKNSTIDAKKDYEILFDILIELKEYNEIVVLQKLGTRFNKNKLSFLHNYLYNKILDALYIYALDDDLDSFASKQLYIVKLLREKQFTDRANKMALKMINYLREYENYGLTEKFIDQLRKIIWYQTNNVSYKMLLELNQLSKEISTSFSKTIQLQQLFIESRTLRSKSHFRLSNNDQKRVNNLLNELENIECDKNSFIQQQFKNISLATLKYLQNLPDAYNHALESIHQWHSTPKRITFDPENYLEALYIFSYSAVSSMRFEAFECVFNFDIRSHIKQTPTYYYYDTIKHLTLVRYYHKIANYDKVETIVKYTMKQLSKWEDYLNTEFKRTVYLSLSISCFVLEDYNNAFYYTKYAVNNLNDHLRVEQISFANLFLLTILYDKKDWLTFENQYNTSYSYFYRSENPQNFEKNIVSTLHKISGIKSKSNNNEIWHQLLNSLEAEQDTQILNNVLSIFNFKRWIKSKIQKIPYKQLVIQETTLS